MDMTDTTSLRAPRPASEPVSPPPETSPSLDSLVDATPPDRDRYVDLLRAMSIVVVIMWHWVFSVTHLNRHGALTMPNPVGDVPLLWSATWLLQIMPLFFFVGGFANLAALEGVERHGGGWWAFTRKRLGRLLTPIGVFLAVWLVGDTVARGLDPSYRGILHWGVVVFVPLWFIGMYTLVVLLAPLTARLHRLGRELTVVAMGSAIALADLGRFHFHVESLSYLNSCLVFLFAHQLGYFWRDGTFTRWPRRTLWALTLGGFSLLVVITNMGVYPKSMVSVPRDAISNMFPTTACIAALALFQIGVAMLLRPAANRLLQRRRAWKLTVSVNAVAMTLFAWHMTALVAVIGIYRATGHELLDRPTGWWWLQRPLWLLAPGMVLAGLVAVFARFELPVRSKVVREDLPVGQ